MSSIRSWAEVIAPVVPNVELHSSAVRSAMSSIRSWAEVIAPVVPSVELHSSAVAP